jgi:hypothetical protein
MARRTRTPKPLTDGPSLPPDQAIQFLRNQRDKGQKLLEKRPISYAAAETWETVTRDVLTKAFGAASPNVSSVILSPIV